MSIAKALQALIDNPDDLSNLPNIVAQVEALEKAEESNQERITKLQEINRNYLSQIPIPGHEPEKKEDEEKPATIEDATAAIMNTLKGDE